MTQKLEVINNFHGEHGFLSNFYPVPISWNNFTFGSVEHAYVASKSKSFLFWIEISKLRPEQAGKAKRKGRKIKIRDDWDMVKISLMRKFLKQKFNYAHLKELLLSTNDVTLIEGNNWHDNYWGDCSCEKCKKIVGQNQLGKLLMKIRGNLNAESINHG